MAVSAARVTGARAKSVSPLELVRPVGARGWVADSAGALAPGKIRAMALEEPKDHGRFGCQAPGLMGRERY